MNAAARGALFFMFIVGVIYGVESAISRQFISLSILTAERCAQTLINPINILDPSHHKYAETSDDLRRQRAGGWVEHIFAHKLSRHGHSWRQACLRDGVVAVIPLVRAMHWQSFATPMNPGPTFDYLACSVPDVNDVKLPTYELAGLEVAAISPKASLPVGDYISHAKPWALGRNEIFSGDLDGSVRMSGQLISGGPEFSGAEPKTDRGAGQNYREQSRNNAVMFFSNSSYAAAVKPEFSDEDEEGAVMFVKGLIAWIVLVSMYTLFKRWGWLDNPVNKSKCHKDERGPR